MDKDRCVVCGTVVPEGRMVCPACEAEEVKTCEAELLGLIHKDTELDLLEMIGRGYPCRRCAGCRRVSGCFAWKIWAVSAWREIREMFLGK